MADESRGPSVGAATDSLPSLVVVVGTNASGKSGLGVQLAAHYGGEVVSADSRQVFAGMDLGSGKITREEMQGVPHHLLDVCQPGGFFSMADYQAMAYQAIEDILARGKVPFLVGGTGLYIASVTEGYLLSGQGPDLAYRAWLETHTTPQLYQMLLARLPDADVEPGARNRVMRILERLQDGSYHEPRAQARYQTLTLGVTWPRPQLEQRIRQRLDRRMRAGMVEEVAALKAGGVSRDFLYKLGLEYRFIDQYLEGKIPTEEALWEGLAVAIRQFAKRQMTWFRRDKAIHWLDMSGDFFVEACGLVDSFLGQ